MAYTASDLRIVNARALLHQECGGVGNRFAVRIERSRQYVNSIIGPTPIRGIGDAAARKIERTFGRPIGWLDHDHGVGEPSPSTVTIAPMQTLEAGRDLPWRSDGVVGLAVSRDWLRRAVGPRDAASIVLVELEGLAGPRSLSGSIALVDRSVSAAAGDGYYLLRRRSRGKPTQHWLRYLSRSLEGVWRAADEAGSPGETVRDMASLEVLGQVQVVLQLRTQGF